MMLILCAGTGIALVIPITSWISAYYLFRMTEELDESPVPDD
ncbi:hypothetical protein [Bacillus sp. OxB-1]